MYIILSLLIYYINTSVTTILYIILLNLVNVLLCVITSFELYMYKTAR